MSRNIKPDFTSNELVEALGGSAVEITEEGLTISEMLEITGRARQWIVKRLKKLQREGRLLPVRKLVIGLDGIERPVQAYQIKK
jgi:hypothetical protein